MDYRKNNWLLIDKDQMKLVYDRKLTAIYSLNQIKMIKNLNLIFGLRYFYLII